MKIILIGAGNVATHIGLALKGAGHNVAQVYSRTPEHAIELATQLGSSHASSLEQIDINADAYIFAVKDDAISTLADQLAGHIGECRKKTLFIHTSGSTTINCLQSAATRYGVIYPLQTLSKNRKINFREVPLFIEGSDRQTEVSIAAIARSIADRVVPMDSDNRRKMHLAAVWACNFVNHCYDIAASLMDENNLPFDMLLPLIDETARKVHQLSPRQAQTGPAVRYDKKIIDCHLKLLNEKPQLAEIYQLMSESIHLKNK